MQDDKVYPPLTDHEERAWELYCKETAGTMHVVDFWEQLGKSTQQLFLDKTRPSESK